ncbi:MAG: hypothetical protein J6I84_03715 [Bacilli bacterium]|nr:hypothetical protein [Bacilli bacterium]
MEKNIYNSKIIREAEDYDWSEAEEIDDPVELVRREYKKCSGTSSH